MGHVIKMPRISALKSALKKKRSEKKVRYNRARKPKRVAMGDVVGSDIVYNCLTCIRWSGCLDNRKSAMFRCSRYNQSTIDDTMSLEELMKDYDDDTQDQKLNEDDFKLTGSDEESIESLISDVIDSNVPVPPDLRIKDRDIKQAKNFYQWATDSNFAGDGMPPFPRQVEIGLKMFAEYCPNCSDSEWFDDVPVDAKLSEIEERVVMLDNGLCPKCGTKKSDLVLNEGMFDPIQLIGLAGQRCVVGSTLVNTNKGVLPIKDFVRDDYELGFNTFKGIPLKRDSRPSKLGLKRIGTDFRKIHTSLENGSHTIPSDFYISKKSKTIKVVTSLGYEIEGTLDHPIMTERGWVKLKGIRKTDNIHIEYGQNVWGIDTYEDGINLARLAGFVTSEGYTSKGNEIDFHNRLTITNKNMKILEFCKKQLDKLKVDCSIRRYDNRVSDVRVVGWNNCKDLEYLFGDFNQKSGTRYIPDWVMKSSKETMAAYLSALYEGDGYILKGGRRIYYTTKSPELAHQIQVVLANFGILSKKYSFKSHARNTKNKTDRIYWEVAILDKESKQIFRDEIGFLTKRKKKFTEYVKDMPFKQNRLTTKQIESYLNLVADILNDLGQYRVKRSDGALSKDYYSVRSFSARPERKDVSVSKRRAIKFLEAVKQHESYRLLDSEIKGRILAQLDLFNKKLVYDGVKSIKLSKKKKTTYDFTIPVSHRFMANGILNHNSGKTTSTTLWESYNLHRFLKLPNPASVYGLLSTQVLMGTFTALTFNQATENVWLPFKNIVSGTPWYKTYHQFLDERGHELGEELYHLAEHSIRYRHRNIFYSPSGPSKRVMRGKCLVGSTLVNVEGMGYVRLSGLIKKEGYHEVEEDQKFKIHTPTGMQPVTHALKEWVKYTYKLSTQSGTKIHGTPEHPMLVVDTSDENNPSYKWVPLSEIYPGDKLVSRRHDSGYSNCVGQSGDFSLEMEEDPVENYLEAVIKSNSRKLPFKFMRASKEQQARALSSYIDSNSYSGEGEYITDDEVVLIFDVKWARLIRDLKTVLWQSFDISSEMMYEGGEIILYVEKTYKEKLKDLSKIEDKFIEELCYEVVEDVTEEDGGYYVYDVTVPEGHSFYANGLISHNTRLCSVVDEIGFFPLGRAGNSNAELERLDAPGVYNALNRSMFTLKAAYRNRLEEGYDSLPKPIMWLISSPSNINDFIMSSYRSALGSQEILRFKYCSWEFNPNLKESMFSEEFRIDPVMAERDYKCNPPIGVGLFFDDSKSIFPNFRKNQNNLIDVYTSVGMTKTKKKATFGKVSIKPTNHPYASVLCVDVGLVNNSFAFSVVSVPEDYNPNNVEDEDILTPVKVLAAGEVMPKDGNRLSITRIYNDCLLPLVEEFGIKYFMSDRWQNAKIASDLEDRYEVETIEYRCKWDDFTITRDLIDDKKVYLPNINLNYDDLMSVTAEQYPEVFRTKPLDHLAWQMMTVRESTNVTVLKGDLGTDDLFRTLVLGCAAMQDIDLVEVLMASGSPVTANEGVVGLVKRTAGGGSSKSQTGSSSGDGVPLGITRRR